jgi:hypothetical protein
MSTAYERYLLLFSRMLFKRHFHLVHKLMFAICNHCSEDENQMDKVDSICNTHNKAKGQIYL